MPEYILISVYKSGSTYKPVIKARFGKSEKPYHFFTASEQGFSERQKAMDYAEEKIRQGKVFLSIQ